MRDEQRVTVVGCGVTGLTAGHILQRRHHRTLFERKDGNGTMLSNENGTTASTIARRGSPPACSLTCNWFCGRPGRSLAGLSSLLGLVLATAACAGTIQGVRFSDSLTVQNTRLRLVGMGLQRYGIIYKVCVAGLYLPPETPSSDALADVPKRLEIHYFHRIKASRFAELTTDGVRQNVGAARFRQVEERVGRLNAAYRNVEPGDRYALTYLPGSGCTLALNGRDLITVPGAEFAAAIYAVWLGDKPVTRGMKAGLMGED